MFDLLGLTLALVFMIGVPAPPQFNLYVTTSGNNSNSGLDRGHAVATIDKARQLAQTVCPTLSGPCQIGLGGGTYYQGAVLGSPLTFGAADSGSVNKPIAYVNLPGETPLISGGNRVTGFVTTGFTCAGGCTQYRAPYSGPLFEGLWYNGGRRFRPRSGATAGNNIGTYFRTSSTAVVLSTDACSLNGGGSGCNGATNNGCILNAGKCWDRIRVPAGTGISNSWANLTVPVDGSNPVNDVEWIYWESWTVPRMRPKAYDSVNRILIFSGAFNTPPCGSFPCDYGPSFNQNRFIVEGVKDLLTLCGQWLLDRTGGAGNWFLYYNACPGENPNTDVVEVPVLKHAMVVSDASYLTFRGIGFEHDNWTAPAAGYISNQTEPTQWAALSVQSSSHITFEYDTIAHTMVDGIEVFPCRSNVVDPAWCLDFNASNTSQFVSFQHGSIYDVGGHCVQLGNKVTQAVDTDATVTAFAQITDTLCDGYGRVTASSFGVNGGSGHDWWITNDEIHDGYHAEVSICRPTCQRGTSNSNGTYNITVAFSLLYAAPQGVTGDIGCLYYATGGGQGNTPATSFSGQFDKILNNRIHDCVDPTAQPGENNAGGGHAIYLDNQTGSVIVEGNIVYRASSACLKNTKGIGLAGTGPNIFRNNIVAYCRLAVLQWGTPTGWFSTSDAPVVPARNKRLHFILGGNVVYLDRKPSDSPSLYLTRGCADSAGFTFADTMLFRKNLYWRTDGALASEIQFGHVEHATSADISSCSGQSTDWDFADFANWQCASGCTFTDTHGVPATPVVIPHEDAGSLIADPGFVSPGYPNDDYHLTQTANLTAIGFDVTKTNATMDRAGRISNLSFNPVVVKTFPTAEFDPSHTNNGDY